MVFMMILLLGAQHNARIKYKYTHTQKSCRTVVIAIQDCGYSQVGVKKNLLYFILNYLHLNHKLMSRSSNIYEKGPVHLFSS